MRLTEAKINRWQADILKAEDLLARTVAEVRRYRGASKGGRLSHLTTLAQEIELALRETRGLSMPGGPIGELDRSETRNRVLRKITKDEATA